jgi:hypothetical protein
MIPATAPFIWFGPELPFIFKVGIRSVAIRGGFDRVILHHDDDLSGTTHWRYVMDKPRFKARRLTAERLPKTHGDLAMRCHPTQGVFRASSIR